MSEITMADTRMRIGAVAVLSAATAVLVALMPPDKVLGAMVRLPVFHGASTWVNMATFTLAGILGLVFLVTSSEPVRAWGAGFRYLSLPLWAVNTVLGMVSMWQIWGGILWTEPRLRMSFALLLASLLVVSVDLAVGHSKLAAGLDVLLAGGLWGFVVLTPNLFHPDNPVLNSGGDILALFFGMVAAMFGIGLLIVWMIRERLAAGPA